MLRSSMRSVYCAICVCFVIGSMPIAPQMAMAQEPIPKYGDLSAERQSEVASLLELAKNNEKRGKFSKALNYYLEAHKLFPHPKLYFDIASSYERLADASNAVKYYKLYLASMPNSKNSPKAKNRIQELKKRLVQQSTSLRINSSPPGATVYLNDITNGPVGTTPTTDLPIRPGKYKLIFKLDGYQDLIKEVDVKSGISQEVKFVMERTPSVNDPGKNKPSASSPVAPWVLLGVGVVATTGAVTFGILHSNLVDEKGEGPEGYTDEELDTKQTYEVMTYVTGAAAILSFTGALILFLTNDGGVALEKPIGDTKASVSIPMPWFSTTGAGGIGIQGRF